MITVRYPWSGTAVTYNDANFLTHGEGTWKLSNGDPANGGKSIAFIQASAGVVVEFAPPCKVEQMAPTADAAAELLVKRRSELRGLRYGLLADLKRALAPFNSKTGRWK